MERPLIAITVGDPAGIGPEIAAKALVDGDAIAAARCVVIGDRRVMERAIAFSGLDARIRPVERPADGDFRPGVVNLIDVANADPALFRMGEVAGLCGRAAYGYIERGVRLALAGEVAAVATAPINKEALRLGGVDFIGHTEIFGALTGTADPLTMFETRGLRVFFLSRHVSLREACDLVRKDRIIDCARRSLSMLRALGIADGTMAIAGLNPHSGERGMFGSEEIDEVEPAVAELRAEGLPIVGPIGADSVFHLARIGRFAAVLSLYHDQGHIATKTFDFERTVAVTGGMPILRTSVDHGTAMDIAGRGAASAVSMVEAIKVAARYAGGYSSR
ncbi:MAG TPA: 4-hydroxythreonine-4-phosphate dehydrogenase PdxA [Treponemataceae bacterium]|nr:4-hydroxythreonine-4-phosphate dehydrogenase PdxA [Treponemataceae bacterium]